MDRQDPMGMGDDGKLQPELKGGGLVKEKYSA